jgi:hypothetical protein
MRSTRSSYDRKLGRDGTVECIHAKNAVRLAFYNHVASPARAWHGDYATSDGLGGYACIGGGDPMGKTRRDLRRVRRFARHAELLCDRTAAFQQLRRLVGSFLA